MKKINKILNVLVFLALVLGSNVSCNSANKFVTIKVGCSPTPHAEILSVVKDELKNQGYELVIKEFTDYILPNIALKDHSIDANYFQHLPFLENFNKEHKTNLIKAASIHYEPFGIYPGNIKTLDELKKKKNAKIAIPNDPTNSTRALLLLRDQGFLELKNLKNATKNDISNNPNKIEVIEIEAAQLTRSLKDVDAAVINGNYVFSAGLSTEKDALAIEFFESEIVKEFANIVAIRAEDQDSPKIKALILAFQNEKVKQFLKEKYGGAVVSVF